MAGDEATETLHANAKPIWTSVLSDLTSEVCEWNFFIPLFKCNQSFHSRINVLDSFDFQTSPAWMKWIGEHRGVQYDSFSMMYSSLFTLAKSEPEKFFNLILLWNLWIIICLSILIEGEKETQRRKKSVLSRWVENWTSRLFYLFIKTMF